MKSSKLFIVVLITLGNLSCRVQNKKQMENTNNPLICDPVEGICGIPEPNTTSKINPQSIEKPIKLVYFTDPICSSCWGIEPQLRKLKLEYGSQIEMEYRMGGLLPDWSYNSGGISKPSDVAHHWDEVSEYYDMPIDGAIWLEDPLHSSYPPSIAFKAAQLQNQEKAILFLREIREMVFLQKKNIAKWENLELAAKKVGLNSEQLKLDYEGKAKILFEEDLKIAKTYGVRGFPTIFFINNSGDNETIYGSKPYPFYETAILKLHSSATKNEYNKSWEALFSKYASLTAKEFSVLSGIERKESEKILNELTKVEKLTQQTTKNGSIWTIKK
jgi:predicted DsbA family dithiol-disulfide isomerase